MYPGVAVAEALVRRGHQPATLRFVGRAARSGSKDGGASWLPADSVAREGPGQGIVGPWRHRQCKGLGQFGVRHGSRHPFIL